MNTEANTNHAARATQVKRHGLVCLWRLTRRVCFFVLLNQSESMYGRGPGVSSFFFIFFESTLALRTPEERLPSGGPKEEFGRMIFLKNISLGNRTKVPWQVLVKVRRGTGRRVTPGVYQTITAAQPHSSLYKGAVQNSP